jgi:hypothetical protein
MNIIVYLIERRYDGSKSVEPVALFRRWDEAKHYIEEMLTSGKEAYGMIVGPLRVSKI